MMSEKSDVILRFNDSKNFVVLVDKSCKKDYSKYLSSQGSARLKFLELMDECDRLKAELASAKENVASLDRELWEAKQSLDEEKQLRRKAEVERDVYIRQLVGDRSFEGEFSKFVTNKGKPKQWAKECCQQLKVALKTANEHVELLRNELSAARPSSNVEEQSSLKKTESIAHYIEEFCFLNNSVNDDSSSVIIPDDECEFSAGHDAEILPEEGGFSATNDLKIIPDEECEFFTPNEVEVEVNLDDECEFPAANDEEILPDEEGEFSTANDVEVEIIPDQECEFSVENDVEVEIIPDQECEFSAENDVEHVICTIPFNNAPQENDLYPIPLRESSPNITTSYPKQVEFETVQCTLQYGNKLFIRPAVSSPDNVGDLNNFYSCALCKKGYKLKRNLKKHMSIHTNEMELISRRTCEVCCRVFKNRTNLKYHMFTHESDPQYKFHCTTCDRGFARQSNLNQHLLTHETDLAVKYRYTCDVCGKGFYRRTDKKRHVRTHTTPVVVRNHYLCSCGKKFKWKSVMKKHMLSHNHEAGVDFDDTFQCDLCKENFTTKLLLRSHMMTHSFDKKKKHRYQCDVCSKVFTRGNHLKVHKLNHETDPDLRYIHRCTVCNKGFTTNSHFTRHKLIHETNPDLKYLYKCSICMKGFSRKDNLKTHFLTHENNIINFKHILEFDPAVGPNVPDV